MARLCTKTAAALDRATGRIVLRLASGSTACLLRSARRFHGEAHEEGIQPLSFAGIFFALLFGIGPAVAAPDGGQADDALFQTISALDTAVFGAFNHCSDPTQLLKHEGYFATDVEFYHDTGGVTWTRDAMLENTRKNVCGHFSRELIPGSLRIYPIKDFGAIETGSHRFCQFNSGKCEGLADFSIVWRLKDDVWQITRVLSYGHRASATPEPHAGRDRLRFAHAA